MAGFVFHVEFGMNETPLTRALEEGNWPLAEHHIVNSPNASYLDDGCYQRIPLFICLCGTDEYTMEARTRTFHLARMLIERGANVNLRVPLTNYGSEYISPGRSCLELLIDLYISLSCQATHMDAPARSQWNPLKERVIGLNKQHLSYVQEVLEDLQDLVFEVLQHGGDLSVMDHDRLTPLHRVTSRCNDLNLLRLLCYNGADLSIVDALGNTPLLSLCCVDTLQEEEDEIASGVETLSVTFNDGSEHVKSLKTEDQAEEDDLDPAGDDLHPAGDDLHPAGDDIAQCSVDQDRYVNTDMLEFLLKQDGVDVNHENDACQTSLFHLMIRGDTKGCHILLNAGADPEIYGFLWQSRRNMLKFSPLLASLMSVHMHPHVPGSDLHSRLVAWTRVIGPLVDRGHFSSAVISDQIKRLVLTDMPSMSHLLQHQYCLVDLMFGHAKAGLKQIAARKVFQCCLENTKWLQQVSSEKIPNNPQVELVLTDRFIFKQFITNTLTCSSLQSLISELNIPRSLLLNFEIHLLYLRFAVMLQDTSVRQPLRALPFGVEDSDSDNDDSSVDSTSEEDAVGDSDLEYW